MRPNNIRRVFISLSILLIVTGVICLFHYSNRPRNINIILITIDSLRPDHLGCYGYKRNTSPNIDKLAKEGVLFTQAISQAPWTWPSINSLITSTYPSTHGVYFWDQDLSDSTLTLPQILKQRDYYTGFISGNGDLFRTTGLRRGLDTFKDIILGAGQITNEAISWIKKNQDKRMFLWMHYMEAHDRLLGIPILKDKRFVKNMTPEQIKAYTINYNKAISYIDSQIAVLLKNLKILGLYKKTVIIITADHGEEICEHGLYFNHGGFLWDSAIKVPLIIFYPNLFTKNKIITQQVQHIDIVPTICDILRIKKPKTFEGRSLLPLIKGKDILSNFAFSEHKKNEKGLNSGNWIYTKLCVRSLEWKLIYTYNPQDKGYELYNLKTDPQELGNLVEVEKEQFIFLKAKLEEWMNRPKPDIMPLTKPLDEETKERLKSLGYLQ